MLSSDKGYFLTPIPNAVNGEIRHSFKSQEQDKDAYSHPCYSTLTGCSSQMTKQEK